MKDKPISEFGTEDTPQLESLLSSFRSSVHAWSAQQYAQLPLPVPAGRRRILRLAPVCLAGGLALMALGVFPFFHGTGTSTSVASNSRPASAQIAQLASPPTAVTVAHATTSSAPIPSSKPAVSMSDEELMAAVDEDVSQRSPDAMSPLVALMSSDSTTTKN
jgi:hypothetical protein